MAFEQAAWRSAAQHLLGGGLQGGIPSLEPAQSARKWLLKHERWAEVKALDCIVCGGIWTDFRHDPSAQCEACGSANASAYHRYWSCPRLGSHTDEAVRATQWMRRLHDTEHQRFECLWGRAILPAGLVAQDPSCSLTTLRRARHRPLSPAWAGNSRHTPTAQADLDGCPNQLRALGAQSRRSRSTRRTRASASQMSAYRSHQHLAGRPCFVRNCGLPYWRCEGRRPAAPWPCESTPPTS